jgi:hypothetical protein
LPARAFQPTHLVRHSQAAKSFVEPLLDAISGPACLFIQIAEQLSSRHSILSGQHRRNIRQKVRVHTSKTRLEIFSKHFRMLKADLILSAAVQVNLHVFYHDRLPRER